MKNKNNILRTALLCGFMGFSSLASAQVLVFQNEASSRVDTIPQSQYRFDALFVDFNSDGCHDLFIVSHSDWGATSQLWNNRCNGSNTFQHIPSSLTNHYVPGNPLTSGWITGLDFNGDGKQDFWGRQGNALGARYRNGATAGAYVPYFAAKENGCEGYCAFADITGDGRLEVITDRRLVSDATTGQVLFPASGSTAQQIVGDIDNDGWPEIIQPANRGYWKNNRTSLQWVGIPAFQGGTYMQMVLADLNNDGYLDLFYLDGQPFSNSNRGLLYLNNRSGGFTDVSSSSGLSSLSASDYGNIVAADFDNDGWQDLMVAGVSDSVRIYRNNKNMTFTAVTDTNFGPASGTGPNGWESGKPRASVADFDNDGRLDIIKTQFSTNLGLWRNHSQLSGRNWMKVRVRGDAGNSDAVGASVRWYRAGTSQLVSHMPVQAGEQHPQTWLHTGLGNESVIDLEVKFPGDGPTHRFSNISPNQEVVVYSNGCLIQNWQPGNGWDLNASSSCQLPPPPPPDPIPMRRNGSQPLPPNISGSSSTAVSTAHSEPVVLRASEPAQPRPNQLRVSDNRTPWMRFFSWVRTWFVFRYIEHEDSRQRR